MIKKSTYVNFIRMLQRRKLDTRAMYRSVRYRVNRGESIRTADPSSCGFRIKRNSCIDSTLYRTNGSNPTQDQTIELKQLIKTDYLRSFNSMMERTERAPRDRRLEPHQQVSFFEDARVLLPDFATHQKQVQESEHSLLTPFHQPFSHVRIMLTNAEKELKSQQDTCNDIRAGLRQIKKENMLRLNQITAKGMEGLARMRGLLRKNEVEQQEKKMKSRRELEELEKKQGENREKFQEIEGRSSKLQVTIFNSTPFNLKQREEYGEVYI